MKRDGGGEFERRETKIRERKIKMKLNQAGKLQATNTHRKKKMTLLMKLMKFLLHRKIYESSKS